MVPTAKVSVKKTSADAAALKVSAKADAAQKIQFSKHIRQKTLKAELNKKSNIKQRFLTY